MLRPHPVVAWPTAGWQSLLVAGQSQSQRSTKITRKVLLSLSLSSLHLLHVNATAGQVTVWPPFKQDQSDLESLLHNNLRTCEFGPHLDCSLGLIVDDGEIPTARSGADSAHPGQAGQLQPELTRGSCWQVGSGTCCHFFQLTDRWPVMKSKHGEGRN